MAKSVNLQEVAIDLLRPYERNAKKHPQDQVEKIIKSIEEFGFVTPCIIDSDYNLIAGHGRVQAAKEMGLETVPCVFVEGLTEAQRKAYILADNRLGELGEWDMDLVFSELDDLVSMDFDIEVTGFEMPEELPEIIEDDYEPPVLEEPRSKLGDLWQLGNHRLICGDSTDVNVIDRLMGGQKADMVFTDPPWNVNYGADDNDSHYKPRTILNDFMPTEDFKDFMSSAFSTMNMASKDGAMTYVVMSAQEWGNLMLALFENGYHWSSTIIWAKDKFVISRKDYHTQYEPIWYGWKEGSRLHPLEDRTQSDLWEIPRPMRSDEHPTMKPVELVVRAIQNSSRKGENILDLFGGAGTTLIASEETNRRCYMCELDPHYADVIVNRWENLTGEKAVLLDE